MKYPVNEQVLVHSQVRLSKKKYGCQEDRPSLGMGVGEDGVWLMEISLLRQARQVMAPDFPS